MSHAASSSSAAPAEPLQQLLQAGVIAPLDYQLARVLGGLAPETPDWVLVAAALTSRAVQAGHVCLDLQALLQQPLRDASDEPVRLELPSLERLQQLLGGSALVHVAGSESAELLPLVLEDGERLYLHRYADYQQRLVTALKPRVAQRFELDGELLRPELERLFGPASSDEPDYQRVAAVLALHNHLCVISGGPGTGKTTTVTKILLLLQQHALQRGEPAPRTVLLAPTGKAAQRLSESIERGLAALAAERGIDAALLEAIPRQAATIHRALGFRRQTPTRFRHDAERPLHADVVLVDEASMVDLALMTKLVEAVPASARLILLGDKDQLASVEAGAILGDIFNAEGPHGYSQALRERIKQLTGLEVTGAATPAEPGASEPSPPASSPIADCTVQLTRSYRYAAGSGIAQLASAVRSGDVRAALGALTPLEPVGEAAEAPGSGWQLQAGKAGWIDTAELNLSELQWQLEALLLSGFDSYLQATGPSERLAALGDFRLLSAHRRGQFGALRINALAEGVLQPRLGAAAGSEFYAGRPIIISENDYQMELFNGDVGVIDRAADSERLVAYFEQQGQLRAVQVSRLPAHESAFAMTVHKSQGSEFDAVALVMPPQHSPVFTRELLYTAVTRARRRVTLLGSAEVFEQGLRARVQRASGLRKALW